MSADLAALTAAAKTAYPDLSAQIDRAAELASSGAVIRPLIFSASYAVVDDGQGDLVVKEKEGFAGLYCPCGDYYETRGAHGQRLCLHVMAVRLADAAGLTARKLSTYRPERTPKREPLATTLDAERAALNYTEQRAWRSYKYSTAGRFDYMRAIHANGEYVQPRFFPGDSEETRARIADLANTLNAELDRQRAAAASIREELAHV